MYFRQVVQGGCFWQLGGVLVLMALNSLAACAPAAIEPGFSEAQISQRERTSTAASATEHATRQRPEPPTPDLTLTTTPWDPSAPIPTRTPVPPPPALIYSDSSGLWQISPDWQPVLILDQPGAALSSDGAQTLYQDGNDIWVIDTNNGARRNITEESNRLHCCAVWWPERLGGIVLGSWPADSDLGPSTGFLTFINSESGEYHILDAEVPSNALWAPGPDGETIAYDRAGEAFLYHLEGGPERLDPAAYGLAGFVRMGGPSWSPDGRQLAWTAAVADPDWHIVVAVFDLTSQSVWLLHPYVNIGRGGWFPPPAWSPDGQYLAFDAEDIDPEMAGIWVAAADGSEEIYLGAGSKPSWSPDGRWLAFTGVEGSGEDRMPVAWLVETDSWYPLRMHLPPDAFDIGWPPN